MKIRVFEDNSNITQTIMVDADGTQYACKHHPMRVRAAVLKSAANLAARTPDSDLVKKDRETDMSTCRLLMTIEVTDE